VLIGVVCFGVVLGSYGLVWAAGLRGPWNEGGRGGAAAGWKDEQGREVSTPQVVFDFYLYLFQRYISPADGPRCQMFPSCSTYARQALRRHGAWWGFFMAADRLLRDNWGVEEYYPLVLRHGRWYFYDPLEANDFWL